MYDIVNAKQDRITEISQLVGELGENSDVLGKCVEELEMRLSSVLNKTPLSPSTLEAKAIDRKTDFGSYLGNILDKYQNIRRRVDSLIDHLEL